MTTYTTKASREDLKSVFIPDALDGDLFKITITPITSEEASDVEFQSLKGIVEPGLSLDDIKRERLGI